MSSDCEQHAPPSDSDAAADARNPAPDAGPWLTSHFSSDEAVLVYAEQMVPSDGNRTNIYWSSCNFYFGDRGGYAGIQNQGDFFVDGVSFNYNNICSIWDLEEKETHLPTEVELVYKVDDVHSRHFGGEGSGLHTSHPMPWYATAIRRWYVPGESATRAAMFMYSYGESKWTLYVRFAVPGADIPLSGRECVAFLERFAGNAAHYRGVYGRHFRMREDGSWEKPLHYIAAASGDPSSWKAELVDEAGVGVRLTAGGCFDNRENSHTFRPDQFDDRPKPAMLTPKVVKVDARYDKESNFISVDWEIAQDRPPQLGHRISVHKDGLLQGKPVATNTDLAPEKRSARFEPSRGRLEPGKYWTSVEFVDIFNQKSDLGSDSFVVT